MRGSLILAFSIMFAAGTAVADKVPTGGNGGTFVPQGDCPTDGYEDYAGSGSGPFVDNESTDFGQAAVADDGSTFTDVVVDIDMNHTWVGDLTIDISYDVECDGATEASTRLVCRPVQTECDPEGSGFGCSDDLGGTYRFSDDGAAELGVACQGSGVQAPGCYSPNTALSAFDGLAKGGCFRLVGEDNAGGDTGSLDAWIVRAADDAGTPTDAISWGTVKSRF